MTIKNSLFFLIFPILTFLSCSSNSSEDPSEELKQANVYHQQSLDLREEIIDIEKKLQEKGVDYRELNVALKNWDKDIIEVPGMEHSHDDAHQRRYHVHNPPQNFTDEEHLEFQKMMHDEISELHEKMVRKLSPEVMG